MTPVSMPLKCAGCTADAVWTVVGDVAKAEQMTAAVVSSPTPSRTPLSICGKKSRQSSRTGMLATLAGGAGACFRRCPGAPLQRSTPPRPPARGASLPPPAITFNRDFQ